MKKLLALGLVLILLLSLTACGKNDNNFEGTWKVESIEYEGSKFSINELKKSTNEDLSSLYEDLEDFYLILKDDGEAYLYVDGYGDSGDWSESDDGSIMIGIQKCEIVDKMICLDFDGNKVYLKKFSNSQEITEEDEEYLTDENDSSVDETTSEVKKDSANDDTEWKQFLKDYEAWVDEYIAIVKKQKDNPSDMSILSDYTEMLSEMTEWTERADEIELELEDTDEALEYSKELLRIAGKLAEAAY